MPTVRPTWITIACAALLLAVAVPALAQPAASPAPIEPVVADSPILTLKLEGAQGVQSMDSALKIVLLMTVLSLAPAILILMTSFTRIVIVLGFLRQAIGANQAPDNQIIIGLALFLTVVVMSPTLKQINEEALQPFLAEEVGQDAAFGLAAVPLKDFMLNQVREKDIALFLDMTETAPPATPEELPMLVVVPGLRARRAEDGLPDGLRALHPVPDHRHGRRLGPDVHGHDDAAAGADQPALQDPALRAGGRLVPGGAVPGPVLPAEAAKGCVDDPRTVIEIGQYAMRTVVFVAGPMLLAGMIVGLVISIFQAATQINEMTMTFVPKILTVFVVLISRCPGPSTS